FTPRNQNVFGIDVCLDAPRLRRHLLTARWGGTGFGRGRSGLTIPLEWSSCNFFWESSMFRYKKNSLVVSGVRVILATGLLVAGDASAANLLTNGSFESGLAPWTFTLGSGVQGVQYQDGTTHDDGNWSEAIQAWSPTSAVLWGARLSQGGISLSAGQLVTVSFAAMATTTRPLSAGIQQTSGTWSWYGLQAFSLTPYWTNYTLSFTMPANDSNTSLNFEMGNMAGDAWIDKASVMVSGATAAAAAAPSLALG